MMTHTVSRIKEEGKSFLLQVAKVPDRYYYILFTVYLVSCSMSMIRWEQTINHYAWNVHVSLFTCVMWAITIYFFYLVGEWKNIWSNTFKVILIGVLLFAFTGTISRFLTTDSYKYIIGAFLCLISYGKNYRKILKCILLVIASILLIAFIAMLLGFALDVPKPGRAFGGHSFGIIYPNNFGFLVFDVLILVWYLYLRRKKAVTIVLFFSSAVFMNEYISCRTVAYLSFLFPLVAIIAEMIQDRKTSNQNESEAGSSHLILRWLLIGSPFLLFSAMMILCWQMDWVHNNLYHTGIHTFAMRFVEGGYALKLNGASLFGHPFQQIQEGIVDYTSEIDMKIDSAFTAYLITRGILWMILSLTWIAAAHRKCLKNKDYRLLVLSLFMLMLCVLERPGLDVWYNGVLLYPLASADYTAQE